MNVCGYFGIQILKFNSANAVLALFIQINTLVCISLLQVLLEMKCTRMFTAVICIILLQ